MIRKFRPMIVHNMNNYNYLNSLLCFSFSTHLNNYHYISYHSSVSRSKNSINTDGYTNKIKNHNVYNIIGSESEVKSRIKMLNKSKCFKSSFSLIKDLNDTNDKILELINLIRLLRKLNMLKLLNKVNDYYLNFSQRVDNNKYYNALHHSALNYGLKSKKYVTSIESLNNSYNRTLNRSPFKGKSHLKQCFQQLIILKKYKNCDPDRVTLNILLKNFVKWPNQVNNLILWELFNEVMVKGNHHGAHLPNFIKLNDNNKYSDSRKSQYKLLLINLIEFINNNYNIDFNKHSKPLYKIFIKSFRLRNNKIAVQHLLNCYRTGKRLNHK